MKGAAHKKCSAQNMQGRRTFLSDMNAAIDDNLSHTPFYHYKQRMNSTLLGIPFAIFASHSLISSLILSKVKLWLEVLSSKNVLELYSPFDLESSHCNEVLEKLCHHQYQKYCYYRQILVKLFKKSSYFAIILWYDLVTLCYYDECYGYDEC